MVIGAVIIKHMLNIDDREVIEQIKENIYLQYFIGTDTIAIHNTVAHEEFGDSTA